MGLCASTSATDRMRIILPLIVLLLCIPAFAQQSGGYALQPGDKIEISVWQDPSLSRQIVIAPDGMISLPLVGHIRAAGLTLQALEKTLSKSLSKNYKTTPQVTVMLSEVTSGGSSQVFVTGQVNQPGTYPITSGMTVVQAIALSGGLGKFAAKSRIQIHRRVSGGEKVFLFDYSEFESGSNLKGNIPVQPGDVIVVPERGLF
jgi:polysaccharide biosynthesis/export protein